MCPLVACHWDILSVFEKPENICILHAHWKGDCVLSWELMTVPPGALKMTLRYCRSGTAGRFVGADRPCVSARVEFCGWKVRTHTQCHEPVHLEMVKMVNDSSCIFYRNTTRKKVLNLIRA